ncbi:MAG: hypothetical protein IPO02_10270 [Bacteroidetes bacterium]|nr:hypothetical protein [Bacteroidota bacterium]
MKLYINQTDFDDYNAAVVAHTYHYQQVLVMHQVLPISVSRKMMMAV